MEWFNQWLTMYPKLNFVIILILAAFIYELGFSRKLPILKKAIIYFLLFIGCFPLTIFKALGLPIIQAMLVASALLIVVRLRRPANLR
ncbi:YlaH-like family protein [Ammoniphilus oxalaticus]|uniref:YlaH-like family protein n=1 Tax=Ammoniphilus oxalaticus TaxID=66863 RepID=UPI000E761822|nr:YlaH-like family protein [Ammoniphilus oxalaticus]